jgi:hypothetical protein
MDLMAWVTMGTVHVRHQQEAREAIASHESAAARAEADALFDPAVEVARARAAQAQAEADEAAQRALGECTGRGASTARTGELHNQRAVQRVEARILELTPRKRRRLANLRRNDFWGPPPRRGGTSPSGGGGCGGGAVTSGGQ